MFADPFGFEPVLSLFKHIIFDFYSNMLRNIFDNVELLSQDEDSLIVQVSYKVNIIHNIFLK